MPRGAGPFRPRITRMVTHSERWHRYVPESGNWHDGTFTRWIAALSAAPWSDVRLTSTSCTKTGINMAVRTMQSIVPTTNLNVIKFSRNSFVAIFQITVLSPYLNTEIPALSLSTQVGQNLISPRNSVAGLGN
ncbi:MAG: hypothetical protein WBC05_00280 [Sedimentisphaerales bacterium]